MVDHTGRTEGPSDAVLRRLGLSRSRLAVSWVFFANGAALGSWVPRIPDVKHALSLDDGVLGFALFGMAGGSLLGLPLSGALTARFGSRAITRRSNRDIAPPAAPEVASFVLMTREAIQPDRKLL